MRYFLIAFAAAGLGLASPADAYAQGRPDRPDRPAAEKKQQDSRPDRATPARQGQGQGQGQGQARGQDRRPDQDRARGQDGRGGPPAHARARRGGPAPDPAVFNRDLPERAVQARARRRGGNGESVRVVRENGNLRVTGRDGRTLLALDRENADRIGFWRAARVDRGDDDRDEARGGSPAFCRSGEGHPVWGQEWCVAKGFGLGGDGDWGWSRVEDVILRRPRVERGTLQREDLIDVLGDVVFGRLALQSLVLGADEPLTGRWLVPRADAPRILRVSAGDIVVAEIVDRDRDDRVDAILFNLGS